MNEAKACLMNIGPAERRKRMRLGIGMFLLGFVFAILLRSAAVPRILRSIVFFPFFLSMLGFFQAKSKTCVVLAAQGVQNLDKGNQKINDSAQAKALKATAQKVFLYSLISATVLTLLLVGLL